MRSHERHTPQASPSTSAWQLIACGQRPGHAPLAHAGRAGQQQRRRHACRAATAARSSAREPRVADDVAKRHRRRLPWRRGAPASSRPACRLLSFSSLSRLPNSRDQKPRFFSGSGACGDGRRLPAPARRAPPSARGSAGSACSAPRAAATWPCGAPNQPASAAEERAADVQVARLVGLGAAHEVLGADHRAVFVAAVLERHRHGVAAAGRPLARQPADLHGDDAARHRRTARACRRRWPPS